jgi:hypothetical protein
MYRQHPTAKRLPPLAERSAIPEDALPDYDRAITFVTKYGEDNAVARARPLVDGRPYAYDYRVAWTNAPRLAMSLIDAAYTVNAYQGQPGWFSNADHEWIDLVLGFDSGYWVFHAGHTANALSSGVRVEAIEALRDGREQELTDDERQVIDFIRAVRDGTMSDEIWQGMIDRLGTLRGTIGLAYLVCILWTIMRMFGAFGVAAIEEGEWNALLQSYKDGTSDPAAATQDWVWETLGRRR